MQPISAAMVAALGASHKTATRAEVLDNGAVVATLNPVSGGVDIDDNQSCRRSFTATLADPTGALVPATAADLLHPSSGNEIRLYRGVTFADATTELATLGTFRIGRPKITDAGSSLSIELRGQDRAKKVQRARWTDTYVVASGTNVGTAIAELLATRVPGLDYTNFAVTSYTTPRVVFGESTENDPWRDAQGLAAAIGYELFFDPSGNPVLRSVPDADTAPLTFTYAEGASAHLLRLEREIDAERTYNGVIVIGEGTGLAAPVRAEAWDTDPASPTYYEGDYGRHPYFLTSPFITTTGQAQAAADGRLRQVLGTTEHVRFDGLVNPAHDAGDLVRLVRARARVDSFHLLSSLNVPLGPEETMAATTRERRIAA